MVHRLLAFVFYFSLIIYSNQENCIQTTIDIYSANITLDCENIFLFSCSDPIIINVPLFNCPLSIGYIEILDKSCLNKQIIDFNEDLCPAVIDPQRYECQDKSYMGLYCNMTSDVCQWPISLCKNNGICYSDDTLPSKYICHCPPGFLGDHCDIDNRICTNSTCWHEGDCSIMNEMFSQRNQTTFECDCEAGYDGTNCELLIDMCQNVTCENGGRCRSLYLSWKCDCLDSTLYYGPHCEYKTTLLQIKQALSKSFASVAIAAIVTVCLFFITMDILKYGFKIDPVDRERRLMLIEQEKKRLQQKKKVKQTKTALQFYYIP